MSEDKEKFKLEDVPEEWRLVVELRAKQQGVDVDDVVRYGIGYDFKKDEEERREKAEALKDRKDHLAELKGIKKTLEKMGKKP